MVLSFLVLLLSLVAAAALPVKSTVIKSRLAIQIFDLLAQEGRLAAKSEELACFALKEHFSCDQLPREYIPREYAHQAWLMTQSQTMPYNLMVNALAQKDSLSTAWNSCFVKIMVDRTTLSYPREMFQLASAVCGSLQGLSAKTLDAIVLDAASQCGQPDITMAPLLRVLGVSEDDSKILNDIDLVVTGLLTMPRGSGLSLKRQRQLQIYFGCSNTSEQARQVLVHEMMHEIVRLHMKDGSDVGRLLNRVGPRIFKQAKLQGEWQKIYGHWRTYLEEIMVRSCVPLALEHVAFKTDFPLENSAVSHMVHEAKHRRNFSQKLVDLLTFLAEQDDESR